MSGKIKEWQDSLLLELGERLIPLGFDPKAKGQSFYRKFDGGRHALHIGFIRHPHDLDITANVAVRFDAIEELVSEFRPQHSFAPKKMPTTWTLGCELGNLAGEGQHRWNIADKTDVVKAADGVIEKFRAIGLPYLERFSSLEMVLQVLSGDDKAAWLHSAIHDCRAMRAIAAAYVLDRKQECLELISKKTQFLEQRNNFGLNGFSEMTEALKSRLS